MENKFNENSKKQYKHIISLGWFCSVSLELERLGLRDISSPFDWLLTSWNGVEECIKSNFKDFLNDYYIRQYNSKLGHASLSQQRPSGDVNKL